MKTAKGNGHAKVNNEAGGFASTGNLVYHSGGRVSATRTS